MWYTAAVRYFFRGMVQLYRTEDSMIHDEPGPVYVGHSTSKKQVPHRTTVLLE